jgi:hypothetical protein
MSGGRLETALPLPGQWMWSRKINGWGTIVHAPTGTMWNRHGDHLSIANLFAQALDRLAHSDLEWLWCEAFERRHAYGRGTLVILDIIDSLPADERLMRLNRAAYHMYWDILPLGKPEPDKLYVMDQTLASTTEMLPLWNRLQQVNAEFGDTYYEGLVAKKANAPYPIQTVDPERKTAIWFKYRFVR